MAKEPESKVTGPGPASVTGDSNGSFSAQGSYGPGPMGRGPYSQPNTFATNKKGPSAPDATNAANAEEDASQAEKANNDAREAGRINSRMDPASNTGKSDF